MASYALLTLRLDAVTGCGDQRGLLPHQLHPCIGFQGQDRPALANKRVSIPATTALELRLAPYGADSFSRQRIVREGKSTILKAHTGTVRCVNFSADGRALLTASDDKTLKASALPWPCCSLRLIPLFHLPGDAPLSLSLGR